MNVEEFDIHKIIDKLMLRLQKNGIQFEYTVDNDSIGGGYSDKGNVKDGSKHTIDIHIGDEEELVENGKVNEEKLMEIISTIYHEYRHLEQTEKYKYHPNFSKDSINIARMNAIQKNGLSNYYFENYRNDPKEIDATKYGFEEAIKYVKEEYPEIDAEKGIVEYVHSYIEEDRNDEYGFHMFDEDKSNTIKDILGQLQDRINHPTRVSLAKVCSGFIEDVKLKAVFTDEFIKTYESCSSVEEKDALIFAEVVKLHPEILQEYPVLQSQMNKEDNNKTMTINGKIVEVKNEKENDFEKSTRYLNGVEISSDVEYEDGSYDKKSRVFVADKGIKISNQYINYTTYRQQYDAKTKTYTDKSQSPLIDKDGNVIGEQESIELYSIEDGKRQIQEFSNIENENGVYHLERKFDSQNESFTLMIDNKLSKNKEKIQYISEDGKETYIYMENGVIGQKITKTDRGTTIDIYKDGKPDATYEYDENGNAIIQMAGIEKLPDNYVKDCFNIVLPEYILIPHKEPEEIYAIDEVEQISNNQEKGISTQELGKETIDMQKDVRKMDYVKKQIQEHMKERTQGREKAENNSYRKDRNSFIDGVRVEMNTDEYVNEILTKFEQDLENGTLEQEDEKNMIIKLKKAIMIILCRNTKKGILYDYN